MSSNRFSLGISFLSMCQRVVQVILLKEKEKTEATIVPKKSVVVKQPKWMYSDLFLPIGIGWGHFPC